MSDPLPTGRQRVVDLPDDLVAANNDGVRAFNHGDFLAADRAYTRALSLLSSAHDDMAVFVHENQGLARFNLGWYRDAVRNFLRALDGEPTSRPDSLRYLITALVLDDKPGLARHYLKRHLAAFGPHPDGWTLPWLSQRITQLRALRARAMPC